MAEDIRGRYCSRDPFPPAVIRDLSATTDLTALVAVSADDGERIAAWFWKPGDLVKQHAGRDRAPYVEWVQAGWITHPANWTPSRCGGN